MRRTLLTLSIFALAAGTAHAAPRPLAFRSFSAPVLRPGATSLSLLLPDGRVERFRVEEFPLLSPALQRQHPEIHTYRGVGTDDARLTARLDVTPAGLRAILFTPQGTAFIDPWDRARSISYWVKDAPEGEDFDCHVRDTRQAPASGADLFTPNGDTLRTYRLVITATENYTQVNGGVSSALSEMVTTLNRIDALWVRDLGIHFQAVGLIPFPAPDPYTSSSIPSADENQAIVDSIFGSNGYDIAQVWAQSGSDPLGHAGASYLPCVCDSGYKAGSELSVGDPSSSSIPLIKVACHELGHTFGASHAGDAPCQHDPLTGYEPGSGTTFMGRTGKCGPYDVQPIADLYFNNFNVEQIVNYMRSRTDCGNTTTSGNTPPTAEAGPDFTIPRGTPFALTGGGYDPDPFDTLTYCWEQHDSSPTLADSILGPLFRSRPATTSPTRYFPDYAIVLADTVYRWERLPLADRLLHFRLIVRDNHGGAGGQAIDERTLTVTGPPFTVLSPNGGESIPSGVFPVTWNVGGGSVAPLVDIRLSTDGGQTWTTLVSHTPNDGAENTTYFTATTKAACRIRVDAVGNIFYDVSHADFTITGGATDVGPAPARLALGLLGSNPGPATTASMDLPRQEAFDLAVYSATGRRIATLASGVRPAGRYDLPWDGRDAAGRTVAPGVYWVRLDAAGETRQAKFVLAP